MRVAMVAATALLLASCAGSLSQERFYDEVRARGGGLSQQQILEAVEAVEAPMDRAAQLRSVTVSAEAVVLEVRLVDESDDDGVLAVGYRDGRLFEPTPVTPSSTASSAPAPLFSVEEAGVEHFDRTVDDAIAEAELPGGFAVGAEIRQSADGPVVEVSVTDGPREVRVLFAADGTLLEVER